MRRIRAGLQKKVLERDGWVVYISKLHTPHENWIYQKGPGQKPRYCTDPKPQGLEYKCKLVASGEN